MDIKLLYYKKLKGNVLPVDYVKWAYQMLENEFSSQTLTILATLEEPLNSFEVEQLFKRTLNELKLTEPSYEESAEFYVQYLLQQILLDNNNAIAIAHEIYQVIREHSTHEKVSNWYEISEMIDDFQYGDNVNNITQDFLIQVIVQEVNKQLKK
ncbi:hypothetical protein [Lysinibacillus piscis]|uniref:Uncharacterized protein n=1 Tax=Lysinibacillus piscis TaxID=2518931 RepID=A0ABQ5NJQ0_9BACI|nr:hypothetical protein [Lysinibacillus sp. KH24]GLC88297.1 hypothetical protein LYSBPC_14240 [Lysinibacillus sp. KH24]